MKIEKKATAVRLDQNYYNFVKDTAYNARRTISNQLNLIVEIHLTLKEKHTQVYKEIMDSITNKH